MKEIILHAFLDTIFIIFNHDHSLRIESYTNILNIDKLAEEM